MAVKLVFTKQKKELEIDASPKRSHNKAADVTDNKIESGANISDHVIQNRSLLAIEGIISSVPIFDKQQSEVGRVKNAKDLIEKALTTGEPVTVYTALDTYSNMIITSFIYDEETGKGSESLIFTLSFKQIETAVTKTTKIPPSALGTGKPGQTKEQVDAEKKKIQNKYSEKENKGVQPKKVINTEQTKKAQDIAKPPVSQKSKLKSVLDFGKNWWKGQ